MNSAHIHLLLNHIPILGSAFGILLLIYGIFAKNRSLVNAAFVTFVITALFAIPVFLTGEHAEESVENIAGVSETIIETHEESAELALWVMEALGILSLITLFLQKAEHSLAKTFTTISLLLSLITFGLMAKVGYEGGKIRHTELNSTNVSPVQNGEQEDDD